MAGSHPGVPAPLAKLRRRLAEVVEIDFFGANGRDAVEGLLSGIERRLTEVAETDNEEETMPAEQEKPHGRTWVTRRARSRRPHRVGLADPPVHRPGGPVQVRGGQRLCPGTGRDPLRHVRGRVHARGDHCTFEVLLARLCQPEPALQAIAEIVHDIDLKDGKFGREEAAGIKTLIAGIAAATDDDSRRLERGATVFEDLYKYFGKKRD